MVRPSWDEYFMLIAHIVKLRSTCLRRKVGAVLVRGRRILATGYNGPPRGVPHCSVTGCVRELLGVESGDRLDLCRGLHAEQNAIIQAAVFGVSTEGATMYVTHFPCQICAKMIVNAGIVEVVYDEGYPSPLSSKVFSEAGVKVRKVELSQELRRIIRELDKIFPLDTLSVSRTEVMRYYSDVIDYLRRKK